MNENLDSQAAQKIDEIHEFIVGLADTFKSKLTEMFKGEYTHDDAITLSLIKSHIQENFTSELNFIFDEE